MEKEKVRGQQRRMRLFRLAGLFALLLCMTVRTPVTAEAASKKIKVTLNANK